MGVCVCVGGVQPEEDMVILLHFCATLATLSAFSCFISEHLASSTRLGGGGARAGADLR